VAALPPVAPDGTATPAAEPTPLPEMPDLTQQYLSMKYQLPALREAAISLTLASLLAAALAFRPRRRGTPERSVTVAQTQIILGIVGAMVMIVVGASLARAFGIVGAASLVRYRAKVNDPKDAGVMLSTLAIGLASGVGLYFFAAFATMFVLAALWILESHEPEDVKAFELKIKGKDNLATLRPRIEELLRRNRVSYELRTTTTEELSYSVRVPSRKTTDRLSNLLLALDSTCALAVDWDEKKKKD